MEDLIKKITKECDNIEFAGIVTLTRLAKLSQSELKNKELPEKFTIRSDWTKKGIRITAATKKTKTAEVFSKDWYMPHHEYSKDRRAKKNFFMIPVNIRQYLGVSEKQLIPKKFKTPRSLLKQKFGGKSTFMQKNGIFVESVDGKAEMLYYFYPHKVHIKKNEWFYNTIDKIYDENLEKTWQQAMLDFN